MNKIKDQDNDYLFKPFPGAQSEFLSCMCDRIFYGGARGGAKTLSLIIKAACNVIEYHYLYKGHDILPQEYEFADKNIKEHAVFVPDRIAIDYPDYVAVLIRRTFPDIVKNMKIMTDYYYTRLGGKWKERYHCYEFASGAKIFLNHCMDLEALRTFIGGNYNFVGIDEANQFPEDWIKQIETSLRSSNPNIKSQLCLTSNPGDIGHKWLKETFVDKCPPVNVGAPIYSKEYDVYYQIQKPGKIYHDEEKISYKFIPSKVFDNPAIINNDRNYVRKLKNLNPILRAMWLEGRWDVFTGLFFDNWNVMHNVIPQDKFVYGKDFSKNDWTLCRFYDYGTKNPFVCLFAAIDSKNNMVIFDEIYETGLSARKQAQLVNLYAKEKYNLTSSDFKYEIADPAYWTKGSSGDELISPAKYYEDEEIYLTPGNNDREAGAKVIYESFNTYKTQEDEEPIARIRFTDNCINCITTIPSLPADPLKPEKVDTRGDDHIFDALRYGAMETICHFMDNKPKNEGWREQLKKRRETYYYNYQNSNKVRKGYLYV